MRQDDILINKVIQEAGLLSRAAARTKALGGAVKQAAGDVATAVTGRKPAPDAGWRGKYTQGKQEQILKTLSNDIIKDLTKLKLVPAGSPLNPTDLQNTLNQYISKYTGVGGTPTPAASTSSTPLASTTPASTGSSSSTPTAASTPAITAPSSATPASTSPTPASPDTSTASTPTTASTPSSTSTSTEPETPSEPIPLSQQITAKNGKIYGYYSPEQVGEDNKINNNPNANPENAKWYELSKPNKKTGISSMAFDIDGDTPDIQTSITNAWQKQNASQQQQQKQTSVPQFESFKNYFWK